MPEIASHQNAHRNPANPAVTADPGRPPHPGHPDPLTGPRGGMRPPPDSDAPLVPGCLATTRPGGAEQPGKLPGGFARDLLDLVGGDVALTEAHERLVLLYPLTPRPTTLVGSLAVALEFLTETEALVPRCGGSAWPQCVSCVRTAAGLDALLAEAQYRCARRRGRRGVPGPRGAGS
ncbi:MAG: hypothetical protein ACRDSL_27005 [Pseudonocardiaceae bacterium]